MVAAKLGDILVPGTSLVFDLKWVVSAAEPTLEPVVVVLARESVRLQGCFVHSLLPGYCLMASLEQHPAGSNIVINCWHIEIPRSYG
jgi:hypothetical protein